ncbi:MULTISPECIES: phospholipase D family protein [Halocynthiibacter]|uniref:Phospholipase D n=1 Tax=Halocynthiibacter halioticoli TaxID=2986804 RepID=A0AAE3IXD7_9RHOB|nr:MULTISPECIES: phospholipase D family protein [Halocynthiibacter]MCV6823987.1 phospholipase D family protein [Halocynthiibacter halioticoli]MCW4056988.1 phospholipase D family protein [Halocynthiibacter sp. SDUM655004]
MKRGAAALFIAAAVTGCTYVPYDATRSVTTSLDLQGRSSYAAEMKALSARHGGKSLFYPLVHGQDSLGARLRLIDAAESTLDIQYFLIKPDLAGAVFSWALIQAAERGVRIRFLIDDVFTTTTDDQLVLLNEHENIEIRLFNPLSRNAPKAFNFLLDFDRVNRRMHNKSLTVDNATTIIGGRNIADEYFQINSHAEFADFDLLATGPIAAEVAQTFDTFWNDSHAIPAKAYRHQATARSSDELLGALEDFQRTAAADIYKRASNSDFINDIRNGVIKPYVAEAEVVSDTPQKLKVPVHVAERTLADFLNREMWTSVDEVTLLTPYFVPRPYGATLFKEMERRGIDVRIVTNSLAATNHSYVHGGYMKYRKELLAAGVEIYEIKTDALQALGELPADSDIGLTMHTKAAILGQEKVFIGSLNYDPRSIEINSELGVFVNSPQFARDLALGVDNYVESHAYKLELTSEGELMWIYNGVSPPQVSFSEPGASAIRRAVARITSWLPVEGQL